MKLYCTSTYYQLPTCMNQIDITLLTRNPVSGQKAERVK